MPTIDANGLDVAYEAVGAGPPLILLHGASSSGRDQFGTLLPVLAAAFRVYVPDARGHAGTRWDPGRGWSAAQLVDDVEAFADTLGLVTFHLLGYSMGGLTALQFAARRPARLRTLVALSIATEREPRLTVGRVLMDPERIERRDPTWARQLAERHDPVQGPGGWRRLLAAIVADLEVQPIMAPGELRSIDAPVLVAAGDRDPMVPADQAWALARQVRHGRLLVLPGVTHDSLEGRQPVLQAALADFYRSTEPTARARAASTEVASTEQTD